MIFTTIWGLLFEGGVYSILDPQGAMTGVYFHISCYRYDPSTWNSGYVVEESSQSTTQPVSNKAVVWEDDKTINRCQKCGFIFTTLRRKHHCRACGQIVCGKCSSHSCILPQLDYHSPVRVCGDCYTKLCSTDYS